MTTKQDIQGWLALLNNAINTVAQKKKQDELQALMSQGMQPQQSTQWQAPPPMRGVTPGVQSAINAPLPQTTTTQPNPLQILSQIMTQRPDLIQQAVPSIQAQTMLGQAGKSPWMETPRGGMQTHALTGQTIENPMESSLKINPLDKKISERISPDNHKHLMMQRPDNTTYDIDAGEVPQGSIGAGERPYFSTVVDRDGNVKVFDTRKGRFIESPNNVIKAAPTEVRMFVSALDNNLSSIKGIRDINNRGDLTGVVSGRARKFGTRFFSDEEAQKLRSRVGQLRTIIYGLSGKQINESEQKWLYDEILPNMSNPTENFEAALDEFEKWVKTKKGELIKQFPNIKDIQEKETAPTGTGKFKILRVEE